MIHQGVFTNQSDTFVVGKVAIVPVRSDNKYRRKSALVQESCIPENLSINVEEYQSIMEQCDCAYQRDWFGQASLRQAYDSHDCALLHPPLDLQSNHAF